MSLARISISLHDPIGTIAPELYGHFIEHLGACVDGGIWVGEDSSIPNDGGVRLDVVAALQRLKVPVLRWPGGCFADHYHWQDGIGPRGERPRRVNLWWGQKVEDNAFGTHEFLRLCHLLGAKPYLAGNLASGSPREMREWVEYCNYPHDSTLALERARNGSPEPFNVQYWGVGNEAWACGGDFSPEDYAREFRRFATFLRDFPHLPLFLIACGPNRNDPEWTQRFFEELFRSGLGLFKPRIHGFGAHYYTTNHGSGAGTGQAGTTTQYSIEQWYSLLLDSLAMEPLIVQQRAIMDGYDPQREIKLLVDEWGTWHAQGSNLNPNSLWQQQNTLRDALVAALTLDIFNRHADKIAMGNLAQAVNVLQSLLLTDGPTMLLTPTYHVFAMYREHQGGQSLRVNFEADAITFRSPGQLDAGRVPLLRDVGTEKQLPGLMGSASRKDGSLTLSVVNPSASEAVEAEIELHGAALEGATVTTLCHDDIHVHNTPDAPDALRPARGAVEARNGRWRHLFAPASVSVLQTALR